MARRSTPAAPSPRRPLLWAGLLAALTFLTPLALAGDEEVSKDPHLTYRTTYEQALLEARIRNLPVFISRHKDF
jgi:hypothetical protein